MNPQTLVLISIRLMALHTLISGFIYGILTIVASRPDPGQGWVSPLPYAVTSIITGIFLLAFAPSITSAIVKDATTISLGALSVADCYTVGFFAVGVYYLALYMPTALNWIFYYFKSALATPGTEWKRNVQISGFLEVLGWLLAGYLLMLYARKWALALARKHEIITPLSVQNPNSDA